MPSLFDFYISSHGALTLPVNTVTYNDGGTTNLDHGLGNVFSLTANGTGTTIGHLNVPSERYSFELHLQWISGTITWPTSWTKGDAAPTATGGYVITGTTVDGGISWKISVLVTPSVIVTDGLVLHLDAGNSASYPGSGTTWFDLASSNDGTFLGDTVYTSDSGGGLVLDGTDDAILFGDVLDDVFAGIDKQFTISMWYKTGSTFPASNTLLSKLGDSSQGGDARQFVFRTRSISGNKLEFGAYFSLGSSPTPYRFYYANETTIAANTIYNFVIVYDGSIDGAGRFTFYVNNVLQTSVLSLESSSWGNIQNGAAQLAIGGFYGINGPLAGDGNGTHYITTVYNRLLTAIEVSQNFEATRGRFGI